MRYATVLALLLVLPSDASAQNFVSRLQGPVACSNETTPLPPHAHVQFDNSVSSFLPLTWGRRCAAPIEGWSASGAYRAEQDWFRQSLNGNLSFAILEGYRGGFGGTALGFAYASLEDRVVVSGGTGAGTLRMTLQYTAATAHTGAVGQAFSRLGVDLMDFGNSQSWMIDAPGELVVDLPFTFNRPLQFRWYFYVDFLLNQVEFGPGEGGSADFGATASVVSVTVLGATGQPLPNVTVTTSGGIHYPTGSTDADLTVTALTEPPASILTGTSFFVVDTVMNGSPNGAASSETGYYLSADGVERTYTLGSRLVPPLSAGSGSVGEADVPVPLTTAPGEYYLLACADATAVVSETDEGNNCRASTSRVSVVSRIPVVVVPGILGTSLFRTAAGGDDHLWLDVIRAALPGPDEFLLPLALDADGSSAPGIRTGTLFRYDALVAALRDAGYRDGIDLFVFPYDWRRDNRDAAAALHQFVETVVVPQSGRDRVDLVVHSMGGLVARRYARLHANGRIDKVIYLGTPHDGSVKSFASLAFDYPLALFAQVLLVHPQTMATISSTFPSMYQLLPRSSFITSVSRGEALSLAESYQEGPIGFLRSARWVADAAGFGDSLAGPGGTREFNVVGSGTATLAGFHLFGDPASPDRAWRWCPTAADGDGTVTIGSSTSQAATSVYLSGVDHERVATSAIARGVVLQILRDDLSVLPTGASWVPSGLGPTFGWCTGSPVRVTVSDEAGRVAGLNGDGSLQEAIPGSSFFGFDHNEGGFLPAGQAYQFAVTATTTGVFDLQIDERTGDGAVARAIQFVDVPVASGWSGRLAIGPAVSAPVLEIDVNADGTPDFALTPGPSTPPGTSLAILRRIVVAAGLDPATTTSMLSTLRVASEMVARGNVFAARQVLGAFSGYLRAQSGKHVPATFAIEAGSIVDAIVLALQ